jgi:hypothetical protein
MEDPWTVAAMKRVSDPSGEHQFDQSFATSPDKHFACRGHGGHVSDQRVLDSMKQAKEKGHLPGIDGWFFGSVKDHIPEIALFEPEVVLELDGLSPSR